MCADQSDLFYFRNCVDVQMSIGCCCCCQLRNEIIQNRLTWKRKTKSRWILNLCRRCNFHTAQVHWHTAISLDNVIRVRNSSASPCVGRKHSIFDGTRVQHVNGLFQCGRAWIVWQANLYSNFVITTRRDPMLKSGYLITAFGRRYSLYFRERQLLFSIDIFSRLFRRLRFSIWFDPEYVKEGG